MAPKLLTNEYAAAAAVGQNGEERGTWKLGAVFFNMDDTLVLSYVADKQAFLAVMVLMAARAPQVDQTAVLRGFLELFDEQPWDLEHKV